MFRAYERLLDATGTLVGLVIGCIVALMCLDVFARNGPTVLQWAGVANVHPGALPWVTELTEYLLYGCTFVAAPWVLHKGAHVRVDAFLTNLSPETTRSLGRLCDLIGLAVSLVLAVYGVLAVVEAWNGAFYARKTWNFPEWLLLAPIPLSGLMLAAEFVLRFLGLSDTRTPGPALTS